MTLDTIGVIGSTPLADRLATGLACQGTTRVLLHGAKVTGRPVRSPPARVGYASNLFDLASECALVILACETHLAARAALTGTTDRPGLLEALQPGSILADFSPGTPDECARLAGQLSAGAIGYVEACLHGSIIYLGGFAGHTERVVSAFDGIIHAERVGPQGTARVLARLAAAHSEAHKALDKELATIASSYGMADDAVHAHPFEADLLDGDTIGPSLDLAAARNLTAPILTIIKSLKG